ncbi:MAG: alkaline phosphatase family protein, partial [Prevotella sp.]|nr:alkaline phosphatase family protein [Prevotella sp.]
ANLLNMYLGAIWGQGKYVEAFFDNQLFFNRKLLESKRISLTDVGQRAQEFISEMAGVSNVYSSLQLLSGTSEQISRVRNGFHPERNGDILIEVAPGWHLQNEDTHEDFFSHSSFLPFPIILYGSGMKGERVKTPVTIDRIAPTVARIIRIRAPNACTSEPLF